MKKRGAKRRMSSALLSPASVAVARMLIAAVAR
jgi:hypothetical protein